MVAALGIGEDGRKTILGIRQGATENATVVGELLADLVERGLDFSQPRLYILDGGKALTAAVKKHAGEPPGLAGASWGRLLALHSVLYTANGILSLSEQPCQPCLGLEFSNRLSVSRLLP